MIPFHLQRTLAVAAMLACFAAGALSADDKAEPPKRTNPLSPLATIDPFVGVFDGDDLSVTIRRGENVYVGEVVKAGHSFAFKGTRSGDTLSGAFEFEGQTFQFSITVRGDEIIFNTPQKLTRRKGGVPVATPDPTPGVPIPAPTKAATEPPLKSATPPASKDLPAPTETKNLSLPPVANPAPLAKNMKADAGRTWSGFPQGAYVVLDEESSLAGQLSKSIRVAFVFQGEAFGKENVQMSRYDGTRWESAGRPVAWMAEGQNFVELGYTAGQPQQEALQIDGRSVPCTTVEYVLPDGKTGPTNPKRLKTWTASGLNLPPQPFPIPRGFAVLESGVLRVASVDGDGATYRVNYQCVSLNQKVTVGQQEIEAAVFKGKEVVDSATGQIEIIYERTISSMIPGGVAKNLTEKKRSGVVLSISSAAAVEMGMSKK